MAEANEEEWGQTEESDREGSSFDDYILNIHQSYFAPDADYRDGEVLLLHWVGEGEGLPEEFKSRHLMYPVGSGWDSKDTGVTAIRVDGGKSKFHPRSFYGHVLARVRAMPEAVKVLAARGTEFEAKIWEGTRWHMKVETIEFGTKKLDDGTEEVISSTRPMPQEFLGALSGIDGGEKNKPHLSSGTLEEQVKELAAQYSDDYQGFVRQAAALEGITENDALFAQVLNEESGIWAEVNKGQ